MLKMIKGDFMSKQDKGIEKKNNAEGNANLQLKPC